MQSPMLKHAIESFEHGLEHFLDGTEKSRKFALLHIDHAIELMLKEKCVQLGKSIYKGDGTTLSIHEAFSSLRKESIAIFEQPRLEELHDLRNTIQHKGLIPDTLTAQFLVEIAYRFTKRFLEQELAIPITEAIPSRYRMFMEGVGSPPPVSVDTVEQSDIAAEHEDYGLAVLSSAYKEARAAENPTSQIVAAYSVLQQAVRMLAGDDVPGARVPFKKTLRDAAVANGIAERKIDKKIQSAVIIRSYALKPEYEVQDSEAQGMLNAVCAILQMVGFGSAVDAENIVCPESHSV